MDSNHRSSGCEPDAFPLDHGISKSSRGGIRTHTTQVLDLAAIPVCVLGHESRVRVSIPAVRGYEPPMGTGPPARSQLQRPDLNRRGTAYETVLDTWLQSTLQSF